MIKTDDFKNILLSICNCLFSVAGPVIPILCILIIVGFGFSTAACDGVKKTSIHNHFKGMNMEWPSDTIINHDGNNETVIFLKGKNLSQGLEKDPKFQELLAKNQFYEIALAFISANHLFFKIADPANELKVKSVKTDDLGFKHIKFQQEFMGILVWASDINVHLDRLNHVYLMQGYYIPTPVEIDTHPLLKEAEAKRIVADNLEAPGDTGNKCMGCRSEVILFKDSKAKVRLAYRVLAAPKVTQGWAFIIDARTGAVLEKLPTVYNRTAP